MRATCAGSAPPLTTTSPMVTVPRRSNWPAPILLRVNNPVVTPVAILVAILDSEVLMTMMIPTILLRAEAEVGAATSPAATASTRTAAAAGATDLMAGTAGTTTKSVAVTAVERSRRVGKRMETSRGKRQKMRRHDERPGRIRSRRLLEPHLRTPSRSSHCTSASLYYAFEHT